MKLQNADIKVQNGGAEGGRQNRGGGAYDAARAKREGRLQRLECRRPGFPALANLACLAVVLCPIDV